MTSTEPDTQIQPQSETMTQAPAHLKRLVLTGFMGAGKSTIGRLLAARIGWNFLDLDAHLEARTHATIPQLFEQQGEARFRRLESTALASALGYSNIVLALGGGTPEDLTNRLLLEQTPATFTIFLDAPFPTLFDRCMLQDLGDPALARPVLADPAAAQLRLERRHPLYRRMAALTIATSDQTPAQTVEALLLALPPSKASSTRP
ncbi:shikimate kinase [Tunturibacter empetritectus]|uniref:Shikimate kinase n=1 Tax=Tunturiibacter lichenicola TaxID=2051959 RepID=A0A7W8N1T0_9BACT|nr:shikimate kinase [Edaphobacter lichenicola]MBB5342617.1 shikimate kinase [Edaphobacter lichenicola]